MRINRYSLAGGRLPLWPVFLTGTLAGILVLHFGKSILLENTGLLDEYTLYHIKYMTVDSSALFYYVLRMRLKSFVLLVVMSTTYLGLAVCAGASFWYGFCVGAFFSASVLRYGLKGFLLGITGVFPQYIAYAPAMAALLLWCEEVNRSIYFRNTVVAEETASLLKRLCRLAVLLGLFLIGCILESFVNPVLMNRLLRFF